MRISGAVFCKLGYSVAVDEAVIRGFMSHEALGALHGPSAEEC
jgi:hypothetical protein